MSKTTVSGALTVTPDSLTDALKAVKPAVWTRSAVQALAGVHLSADERGACLHATNMETAVRRVLACRVETPIDVVVPHADIEKAAKALGKESDIRLEHIDDELVVKGGTRVVRLKTLKLEDFPPFPNDEKAEPALTADATSLAHLIGRAHPFASDDETRPILTGIYFDTDDASVCATDSYRLAIFELNAIMHGKHKLNIPARGLKLAAKAMKTGLVTMTTARTVAFIDNRAAGERWAIRLIDGQYPNYRQLIPDGFDLHVTIPTPALRSACELAVTFSRRNAPMRVSVNGEVKVAGHTTDVCSFEETLAGAKATDTWGKPHEGEEFEIGFNPEFMRSVAKTVQGPEATLKLISPLRPGVIVDGQDQFILMPIRLNV